MSKLNPYSSAGSTDPTLATNSPLLPTNRYRPSTHPNTSTNRETFDDPSLLADLSIDDEDIGDDSFMPSSPIRPSSRSQQFPVNRSQVSGSSSRSSSVSFEEDERPQSRQSGKSGRGGPTSKPRFSLFAPPKPPSAEIPDQLSTSRRSQMEEEEDQEDDREEDGEEGEDQTIHATATAGPSRLGNSSGSGDRDDRLRESLYELRRMNEVFDGFLGALEASRGHNERLAIRVKQTSALLDEYTSLLGQAEHTQKLLSNPNWTGAHDDAAAIEAEQLAAEQAEQARQRQEEEAAEAARLAEEEKQRRSAEVERNKEASRGAPRGRGSIRGGVIRGRGSGIPTSSTSNRTGAKIPTTGIRKPTPSTTGTSGGIPTGGIGKYGHVASSGYGPASRK